MGILIRFGLGKLALVTFMLLTLGAVSENADAAVFRNAYVSFELPSKWKCILEETEWVCRSQFSQQAKEAIIILTAKEVGPQDSIRKYQEFLKAPRQVMTRRGARVNSRVFHAKGVRISNHMWVDGFHLGSEIPSYYTRYLATVKEKIAILVTFSAHKLHFTKYSADFFKAIQSLKVVASKSLMKRNGKLGGRPGLSGPYGTNLDSDLPIDMDGEGFDGDGEAGSEFLDSTSLLALALLLGVAGFYIWKKKKTA